MCFIQACEIKTAWLQLFFFKIQIVILIIRKKQSTAARVKVDHWNTRHTTESYYRALGPFSVPAMLKTEFYSQQMLLLLIIAIHVV